MTEYPSGPPAAPRVARRAFRDLSLPLLGLGLMRLPLIDPERSDSPIDLDRALDLVDRARAGGVNYFDTAWAYHQGTSESFAGRALSRYPRSDYFLASKMPIGLLREKADLPRIFEAQLERCRTAFFDFYLLHDLNRRHWPLALELEVYQFLEREKERGRIRHLGFSFHDGPELLAEILAARAWDFAQLQLNYYDWDSSQNARGQYQVATSAGLPLWVMEPVRGGMLADLNPTAAGWLQTAEPQASPASWALRFAAGLPGVVTVLSGMSSPVQLDDNIRTLADPRPLSPAQLELAARVAALYRVPHQVPCTACGYCLDCPEGLDLPRLFKIYNASRDRLTDDPEAVRAHFREQYQALPPQAQAERCTGCGRCRDLCPQQINPPDRLARVAAFAAGR